MEVKKKKKSSSFVKKKASLDILGYIYIDAPMDPFILLRKDSFRRLSMQCTSMNDNVVTSNDTPSSTYLPVNVLRKKLMVIIAMPPSIANSTIYL